MAPQVGLEPTTVRLTAECSTTELLRNNLERVKRIELSSSAWKAEVLPLNYTRKSKKTATEFESVMQILHTTLFHYAANGLELG